MGRHWVEWDLPADRDVDRFWRLSVGDAVLRYATHHKINVRSSFASTTYCYQNKYGITTDFGGYPGTLIYASVVYTSMSSSTACMFVTVIANRSSRYGFRSVGNYYCPFDNDHWPAGVGPITQPSFVSVWLR